MWVLQQDPRHLRNDSVVECQCLLGRFTGPVGVEHAGCQRAAFENEQGTWDSAYLCWKSVIY